MNREALISVVVPIYKVEAYLEECLRSICGQSYSSLEIILIDDGSPDRCGAICDEAARNDRRIRVIHQENRGLSAARNAGLEVASGQFVSFIDSDDYLDPHFYERLLTGFEQHPEVDIVGCMHYADTEGVITRPPFTYTQAGMHSYADMCEKALLGKLTVCVWNKLFRAEVLKAIRFREGRIVEDVLFAFDFSFIAKSRKSRMLLLPDALYYYRIREGSICHNNNYPVVIESIRCQQEIADYYRFRDEQLYRKLKMRIANSLIGFHFQMQRNPVWKRKYYATYHPMLCQVDVWKMLTSQEPAVTKALFLIARFAPWSFPYLRVLWRGLRKLLSVASAHKDGDVVHQRGQ